MSCSKTAYCHFISLILLAATNKFLLRKHAVLDIRSTWPQKFFIIGHDRTENLCTVSTFPLSHTKKFSKALYGTTGGTYSARVFRPVMTWIWFGVVCLLTYIPSCWNTKIQNHLFKICCSTKPQPTANISQINRLWSTLNYNDEFFQYH